MRNEEKDLAEKKSSWIINNLLDVLVCLYKVELSLSCAKYKQRKYSATLHTKTSDKIYLLTVFFFTCFVLLVSLVSFPSFRFAVSG